MNTKYEVSCPNGDNSFVTDQDGLNWMVALAPLCDLCRIPLEYQAVSNA